jgi:hypothetical protein
VSAIGAPVIAGPPRRQGRVGDCAHATVVPAPTPLDRGIIDRPRARTGSELSDTAVGAPSRHRCGQKEERADASASPGATAPMRRPSQQRPVV